MIRLRPVTFAAIISVFAALIGFVALEFAAPERMGKSVLLDFDVFHLVAVMIGEGNMQGGYDPQQLLQRQSTLPGFDGSQLFFSYPPPFAVLLAPLGGLPTWLAYLLFMGGALVLYLWSLRRLAGEGFHTVLVLMLPLLLLVLRAGQNGLLTGALMGLAALGAVQGRARGGVPLGMMVVKPHLAVGFGLWLLLERRWGCVLVALATVLATSGLSMLVFGPQVWTWFLGSAATSSEALRAGVFPLFRMTSVYAFALSIGAATLWAMLLHVGVILAGIASLFWLRRIGASARVLAGAALYLSALISPYNYDYDLAMLGGAAALLIGVVLRQASRGELGVLFLAVWGVSLYGFLSENLPGTPPSIGGPILVGIGVLLLRLLRREAGVVGAGGALKGRRVRP